MSFEIEKDKTKWMIGATGSGWELMPKKSNSIIMVLNDYVKVESYGVQPDYLCMMDFLDEKPSVVSGQDNLGAIVQRINTMRCKFVAPVRYEEIPLSEAFPLKEVVEKYGLSYFTNTICYMIAYALLNGAKDISIYGVNQAGSHEYMEEKGGVEAWIGLALGLGVKVTVYGQSSQVLKHKGRYGDGILYGYGVSYEDVIRSDKRYGESVIKRLLVLPKEVKRTFRKFGVK